VVTPLLKNEPELLVVGDDAVVNDGELVVGVGAVRVAVCGTGLAVGGPAGVSHGGLGEKGLAEVDLCLGGVLAEGSDLSDLLEQQDFAGLVAVDLETCRGTSTRRRT
jgi:hypothetical protein